LATSSTTYNSYYFSSGITLGKEFSYVVNVHEGIMYLSFSAEGHPTKTFTKNLHKSDFVNKSDIPEQVRTLFGPIDRDGTERAIAYAGEKNYFKQGAYNQTNGEDPKTNMVWSTGSETYDGDIPKQYDNGSYTEVWFKDGRISKSTMPDTK